jgi:type IV pilus assembly protein PilA
MKCIIKSKKGFTLIEMMLVIAIIVILAGVLALSIGNYIARAKIAASSVSYHNAEISSAVSEVNVHLGGD